MVLAWCVLVHELQLELLTNAMVCQQSVTMHVVLVSRSSRPSAGMAVCPLLPLLMYRIASRLCQQTSACVPLSLLATTSAS